MSATPSARELRLVLAAACALMPALLAPAAVGARTGSVRPGAAAQGCQLELQASSPRVIAGESATLTGSLSCPATVSAAEQTVALYGHVAGIPGANPLGTVTTEADGAFQLSTEALSADASFYATVPGARSSRVWVRVAPLVTISGPPSGTELTAGGGRAGATGAQASATGASATSTSPTSSTVTFTGTVQPEEAGPRVLLERQGAGASRDWIVLGSAPVGAGGGYSITHTFGIAGTADVRVVLRARRDDLAGVSPTLTYQIVRAAPGKRR
jgi:hypothetical protein